MNVIELRAAYFEAFKISLANQVQLSKVYGELGNVEAETAKLQRVIAQVRTLMRHPMTRKDHVLAVRLAGVWLGDEIHDVTNHVKIY